MFKDPDPKKQVPELAFIKKLIQNPNKFEKFEKQYDQEIKPKSKDYLIKMMTKVDEFKTGRGFGELALMNSKPRAASIKALEDCSFATLSKKDYDNIIGQAMRRDFEAKTTVLINIPAFKHLTSNTLKMVTFYMKEKTYNKNTILFNEGDPVKGLFLVKEGEFELSTKFNVKLDEKYKTQALPVTIKREIKF